MATFNYLKAVWKNGPGVVTDAPAWAVDAIENLLAEYLAGHDRSLIGVQLDAANGLALGIFVSPAALGTRSLLEDARGGSFIHVIASDHPESGRLVRDRVQALFESSYGAPLSDSAIRQQRNFMLLDHPFHRELATDLFVTKDLLEQGGVGERTSHGDFHAAVIASAVAAEPSPTEGELDFDDRVAEQEAALHTLRELLRRSADHRDEGAAPEAFEGLSYREVVARLAGEFGSDPSAHEVRPEAPRDSRGARTAALDEAAVARKPRVSFVSVSVWAAAAMVLAGSWLGGFAVPELFERETSPASPDQLESLTRELRDQTARVEAYQRQLEALGAQLEPPPESPLRGERVDGTELENAVAVDAKTAGGDGVAATGAGETLAMATTRDEPTRVESAEVLAAQAEAAPASVAREEERAPKPLAPVSAPGVLSAGLGPGASELIDAAAPEPGVGVSRRERAAASATESLSATRLAPEAEVDASAAVLASALPATALDERAAAAAAEAELLRARERAAEAAEARSALSETPASEGKRDRKRREVMSQIKSYR